MQVDKDGANPERVKQELSEAGLLPEEWGGKTPMIPVWPFATSAYACIDVVQVHVMVPEACAACVLSLGFVMVGAPKQWKASGAHA